jgi:plasmid stabilization system protein ParE
MGNSREVMSVGFHVRAHREVSNALDYYEACQPGLGKRLDGALRELTAMIGRFPAAAPMWQAQPEHRIAKVDGFPFRLPYQIKRTESRIVVLALAHTSRRYGYWLGRLSPG